VTSTEARGEDSDLGGARGVLAAAQAWRADGRSFALALVVEAEGSTYRKPGAFAVIAARGERRGALSGGCLEPGVEELALHALESDAPQSAEFDTRGDDDVVFGSGSGCRGRMRVIAIPVRPDRSSPLYDCIVDAMEQGEALCVALAIEGPEHGLGTAWNATSEIQIGTTPAMSAPLAPLRGLARGRHRMVLQGRTTEFALFHIRPPLRLLLFGAGPEASPLLRCARTLGWFTVIADHREALLMPRCLPADRLLCARPPAACAALDPLQFDAAIAMTHLASADLDALRALAASSVGYVGLLGPPARRDELLAQLDDASRAALGGRLHAPVGLALGGEGPGAIALSIVADLQRHLAERA